jgi:hypothetical protein
MYFTDEESLKFRKQLLNKEIIEQIFNALNDKNKEVEKIIQSVDIEKLDQTQKHIAKSRLSSFDEFKLLMEFLKATLLNVAEHNESLTKLIEIYDSNESQQNIIICKLKEEMTVNKKEMANIKNNPTLKWIDNYIKPSSKSSDE